MVTLPVFLPYIMAKTDDKNKQQEQQPVKKTMVAAQKTFSFVPGTEDEAMDGVVNPWLMAQAKSGRPAQLGKTFSNHFTGKVYIVYMYPRELD